MPKAPRPQRARQPQRSSNAPLTDQQKDFCREWVQKPNGTQAAIRAGYAPNSAKQAASRLLGETRIRDYIEKLQAARTGRPAADKPRITEELEHLAFARLTDLLEYDAAGAVTLIATTELPPESKTALKELTQRVRERSDGEGNTERTIETKVAIHDKVGALTALARIQGYLAGPSVFPPIPPGGTGAIWLPDVRPT